jgi:hypothetical protein
VLLSSRPRLMVVQAPTPTPFSVQVFIHIHLLERSLNMMPSWGPRLMSVRAQNPTPVSSSGFHVYPPDGAQPKHDALLGAQADGGARQPPRRRVQLPQPGALPAAGLGRPRQVDSRLHDPASCCNYICFNMQARCQHGSLWHGKPACTGKQPPHEVLQDQRDKGVCLRERLWCMNTVALAMLSKQQCCSCKTASTSRASSSRVVKVRSS